MANDGPWYCVELTEKDAAVQEKAFTNKLENLRLAGADFDGAAILFTGILSNTKLYFSPPMANLIPTMLQEYLAVPCEQPKRPRSPCWPISKEIGRLGGDPRVLDTLEIQDPDEAE